VNNQIIIHAAQTLATATNPQQTKAVEAVAKAAQAWAKEQNDYETYIAATHLYIMSRRRTTELIQPYIQHGGNFQGNQAVTLNDFGFTKMQWNRRVKELNLSQNEIEGYFDECIAKKWEPSLFGLWKYGNEQPSDEVTREQFCTCPTCGQSHRSAK
jgi:uncharacterized C2H2 Zn-finger protein